MAKLSAHGKEVARVRKSRKTNETTTCVSEYVLMSDGAVLSKATFLRDDGSRHNLGYNLVQKKGSVVLSPALWLELQVSLGYEKV